MSTEPGPDESAILLKEMPEVSSMIVMICSDSFKFCAEMTIEIFSSVSPIMLKGRSLNTLTKGPFFLVFISSAPTLYIRVKTHGISAS